MPKETLTRISLLLPISSPITAAEAAIVDGVLTAPARFCGGVTISARHPVVFEGLWIDGHGNPIKDHHSALR